MQRLSAMKVLLMVPMRWQLVIRQRLLEHLPPLLVGNLSPMAPQQRLSAGGQTRLASVHMRWDILPLQQVSVHWRSAKQPTRRGCRPVQLVMRRPLPVLMQPRLVLNRLPMAIRPRQLAVNQWLMVSLQRLTVGNPMPLVSAHMQWVTLPLQPAIAHWQWAKPLLQRASRLAPSVTKRRPQVLMQWRLVRNPLPMVIRQPQWAVNQLQQVQALAHLVGVQSQVNVLRLSVI